MAVFRVVTTTVSLRFRQDVYMKSRRMEKALGSTLGSRLMALRFAFSGSMNTE